MEPAETSPGPAPSDADLARRIGAAAPGEAPDAEEELYRRLAPRVRRYGLRHLRDAQAASDLVQQVMIMTIESLRAGRVRDPDRIASFVLGACRMMVQDQRRGDARRQRLLDRYAGDAPVPGSAPPPAIDAIRLRRCLEALAARERSVVVMSFYADRSAEEVAADLGLSAGNVRVIRHRAIAHLRDCMAEGARS